MVRVAFDEQIFAIQHYGGISRQFAELAKQYVGDATHGVDLQPLHTPIVNRYVLDAPELVGALQVTASPNSYRALARFFTHLRPSGKTARGPVDVLHSTFYLPHGLTGYGDARRVVTVHDMIPELMPSTRRRLDFLTLKRRYVFQADHVICVSESTRQDLLRTYGDIPAPISVVHHGVDAVFQPGAPRWPDLPERYVLFVGNRGEYKDAAVLLRAFAKIASQQPDLTLLFVGGGPFNTRELRLLRELGVGGRVKQMALPDEEMSAAYGNAELCVFPSRFEGFGFPALESMACGAPTILADASSLPEVGGDAARYFRVGDADALAEVLSELVNDDEQRRVLSTRGVARAQTFTWQKAAHETAHVYASLLK